jgi:hypothetical protein
MRRRGVAAEFMSGEHQEIDSSGPIGDQGCPLTPRVSGLHTVPRSVM